MGWYAAHAAPRADRVMGLKLSSSESPTRRITMPWKNVRAAALLLGIGAACTSPSSAGPARTGGTHQPPPRPGSSISHTQLCSCRSCTEGCCNPEDRGPEGDDCASDGYDFEARRCGLAIRSCAGQCGRHVWRVRLVDSCLDPLPDECCDAQ